MSIQTIDIIVPIALKETIEVLGPQFQAQTGYQLIVTHMLNPEVTDFIAEGAKWDIAMTNPWHVDEVIEAGNTKASSHQMLGRSPLAFATQGTKAVPLRQTSEEIAELLRQVETIAITGVGTSGGMFRDLAKKLGVWDDVKAAVRPMEGGGPIRSLVAGEVEMATVPLSNIVTIQGIVPVAACPDELDVHIDVSLCLNPEADKPAHDLAQWLSSSERDEALAKLGVKRLH